MKLEIQFNQASDESFVESATIEHDVTDEADFAHVINSLMRLTEYDRVIVLAELLPYLEDDEMVTLSRAIADDWPDTAGQLRDALISDLAKSETPCDETSPSDQK